MEPTTRRLLVILVFALAMFPVLIIMDRSGEYEVDPETSTAGVGWINLDRLLRSRTSSAPTLSPTNTSTAIPTLVPTRAPTNTPTPVPFVPEGEVEVAFFSGWHEAGGENLKDDWSTWRMINCESTWYVVTDGDFLGLAQFEEETWIIVSGMTELGDWTNPYHQGFNAATWANLIEAPGSSTGWPYCWWV